MLPLLFHHLILDTETLQLHRICVQYVQCDGSLV